MSGAALRAHSAPLPPRAGEAGEEVPLRQEPAAVGQEGDVLGAPKPRAWSGREICALGAEAPLPSGCPICGRYGITMQQYTQSDALQPT